MKSDLLHQMISLIDLTNLNANDSNAEIALLCDKATSAQVAAVCIYPNFVKQAALLLADSAIKVATVANFPGGTDSLSEVVTSIQQSIQAGAQEIDVVFPYADFLAGNVESCCDFIKKCKETTGEKVLLKVILESGAFNDTQMLATASRDVLRAGADFLKTSTGKIPTGATLQAATTMLMVIKELTPELNRPLGFKVSGGVRTIDQATDYLNLAFEIMGPAWVCSRTFRFGASQLLDSIVSCLDHK